MGQASLIPNFPCLFLLSSFEIFAILLYIHCVQSSSLSLSWSIVGFYLTMKDYVENETTSLQAIL